MGRGVLGRGPSIIIKHKEYITDITSGSDTNLAILFSRYINPGDPVMFPYLSPIATMYEYFKFKTLKFHYVNQVGSNTAGKILFSIDYGVDSLNLDADENVMGNAERAVTGSVWNSLSLTVPNGSMNKTSTPYHKVTSQ